ncbi:TetR/AcrR family transcriptional regulator [Cryptosporangium aurantiacum]|uniref:Transcriptional regulator, TetR family n=1 Tax=Cryptosporangium aurantiacum TaxID=134849 RepID=A0A1M7MSC2_9ACTN|nr:TetR/AcrR family transcriptional regulator [Cryptosporangium aurantiacum]SHM93881.1 transcriptional regulator, TetR family [Cryptosporangium aurantiacum]
MPYVSSGIRRRQIVLAARRVLERRGLARASLRAVADEAGIALSTLQHVFKTREALFRAVVEEMLVAPRHALPAVGGPDQRFGDWLTEALQELWQQLVGQEPGAQLARFEVTLHAVREGLAGSLARWNQERREAWVDKTAALAGWDLRLPAEQVARLVSAFVDGLLLQYLTDPDPERAAADLRHAARAVAAVATAD